MRDCFRGQAQRPFPESVPLSSNLFRAAFPSLKPFPDSVPRTFSESVPLPGNLFQEVFTSPETISGMCSPFQKPFLESVPLPGNLFGRCSPSQRPFLERVPLPRNPFQAIGIASTRHPFPDRQLTCQSHVYDKLSQLHLIQRVTFDHPRYC